MFTRRRIGPNIWPEWQVVRRINGIGWWKTAAWRYRASTNDWRQLHSIAGIYRTRRYYWTGGRTAGLNINNYFGIRHGDFSWLNAE
jgi:hypothetical protein